MAHLKAAMNHHREHALHLVGTSCHQRRSRGYNRGGFHFFEGNPASQCMLKPSHALTKTSFKAYLIL